MTKQLLKAIPILLMFVTVCVGCGNTAAYQDVLTEYSSKLREASPTILEEFKEEATALNGDLTKLAELSSDKISKLAEISVEGTIKMAEIKLKNNDENGVYEEWAAKLSAVYEEEAKKIIDAYMELAIG